MTFCPTISRRRLLQAGAAAAAAGFNGIGPSHAAAGNPVVVELFTSQGCGSCPPADAFLADLAKQPHVVALGYHVDYWDYLGWKDTLGKPEFSQRQYDYAHARGDMDVYTPQMIINGLDHLVGSDRARATSAIGRAAASGGIMPLTLSESDMELIVDIGAGNPKGETTLWVLPVVAAETVKILKGEIAGQEIAYCNVVRAAIPAGMWSGEAKTVALPKESVMVDGSTGCVALLQQGKVGPVVGLGQWGRTAG